jgi:hypothetical protein
MTKEVEGRFFGDNRRKGQAATGEHCVSASALYQSKGHTVRIMTASCRQSVKSSARKQSMPGKVNFLETMC